MAECHSRSVSELCAPEMVPSHCRDPVTSTKKHVFSQISVLYSSMFCSLESFTADNVNNQEAHAQQVLGNYNPHEMKIFLHPAVSFSFIPHGNDRHFETLKKRMFLPLLDRCQRHQGKQGLCQINLI